MYKHNIYTNPGLTGFGAYGVVNPITMLSKAPVSFMAKQTAVKQASTVPGYTPPPTGIDALPTWAFVAIPVGLVAVAAFVYYKFV